MMTTPHKPARTNLMKSALALLLILSGIASTVQANDPAIPAEARDRFLNGVHDFAGGRLTPGAPQDSALVTATGGGNNLVAPNSSPAPASWRAPNGKVTQGSLVRSTVTPAKVVGQTVVRQNVTQNR